MFEGSVDTTFSVPFFNPKALRWFLSKSLMGSLCAYQVTTPGNTQHLRRGPVASLHHGPFLELKVFRGDLLGLSKFSVALGLGRAVGLGDPVRCLGWGLSSAILTLSGRLCGSAAPGAVASLAG